VYGALEQRSKAQFHLLDAITPAEMVPSFVHFGLQGSFLQRWESVYAVLIQRKINVLRLRVTMGKTLLADAPSIFGMP